MNQGIDNNKDLGFIKKVNAVFLNIENIQKSVELFSKEAIEILDKVSKDDIVELKALSFCLDELQEIYNNLNFILQSKEFVKDMAAYEVFVEEKLDIMEQREKIVKDLSINVEQTYQLVESRKDEIIGIIYSVVKNTRATLGLDNVDNTSDLDKPVSNATQEELDKKIDKQNIEDSFTCDDSSKVLSAKCGKDLKELIDKIDDILLCDDINLNNLQKISDFIKVNKNSIETIEEKLKDKLEQSDSIQSALKLENPRTISLNGAVSGKAVFDGSCDITIETTGSMAIGSYALVVLKDKFVWQEAIRRRKIGLHIKKGRDAGYYPTNVSYKNENIAGSELVEVNSYLEATERDLSGTWFLQGEARNIVTINEEYKHIVGRVYCLAVRVA